MAVEPDDFLLKEYESAVALTNHVDVVRNSLTSFFLIFAGVAVGALSLLLKEPPKTAVLRNQSAYVGVVLLIVALVGCLFIGVLARLRRVQLERYEIVRRIREHFLDASLLPIIGLTSVTLPREVNSASRSGAKRATGTYLWLATILLTDSAIATLGAYLLLSAALHGYAWLVAIPVGALFGVLQDVAYFRLARTG